jgi:hypothetical protein
MVARTRVVEVGRPKGFCDGKEGEEQFESGEKSVPSLREECAVVDKATNTAQGALLKKERSSVRGLQPWCRCHRLPAKEET